MQATKADLNRPIGVDTSKLSVKTNLACLKSPVDKVDIDKLKTVPTDLSKLSNVAKVMLLRKMCMINWLPKAMLLILRYQFLPKHMFQINKILTKDSGCSQTDT